VFATDDTIVAIATPPGRAGLGVVRLSGPDARAIAERLAPGAPLRPRRVHVRRLDTSAGGDRTRDQVVVTLFAAPASYTGEDVAEISAHGSPVLLEAIVRAAMAAGARLARPGEFTFRAYVNGKIDLPQAEAVADLIDAVTPAQARLAFDQLDGTLSRTVADIERRLFDLRVRLEASLDFPDEGYHFVEPGAVAAECEALLLHVRAIVHDARQGRLLREGCRVAIVGEPNVGKSALFNALLGTGRAIVTAVPGTTRDLLTERVDIGGLAVTLIDTAGVRDSDEPIEREGIARAREAAGAADVRVVVLDRSRPFVAPAMEDAGRTVVVANKADLPSAWRAEEEGRALAVSALSGAGLDRLRDAIVVAAAGGPVGDTPAVSNTRHLDLLAVVRRQLELAAGQASAGAGEEIVLATLQDAFGALDEIVGKRSSEDVLREIFARFCIGK
jgi:tRNA modification GTPase